MNLLLIDGHNLLYRSFVSLPAAITTREGAPINAVYGTLAAILRFARDFNSTHVVAAFDVPETPTFRHRLYPPYQGQRGPLGGDQAVEFARQVEVAKDALPRIGVPALACPGYEADDIIGTLACSAIRAGSSAILVSTDRDLLQLVQPGIEVFSPGPKAIRVLDAEGVRARLGVGPEGVTTFKALAGDASDNIPGVPGIGTKIAASLVNEYGDLESMFARLDELPARTATLLKAGQEEALLFRTLVTLRTDLDLALPLHDLPTWPFDANSRVRQLLTDAGYG